MTKRELYLLGVRTALPTILGFVPIGIAFSVIARGAGINAYECVMMSALVVAGAAQIMVAGMLEQGASVFAMIAATFVFNIRHLIMSTCVFNLVKHERRHLLTSLLAAFCVIDESFAIFTTSPKERASVWYLFGITSVMYAAWVSGTALGALASDLLPRVISDSCGIVLYAMYIGLLAPNMKKNLRLSVLVVMTAAINMGFQRVMAPSWALVSATLLGAGLGIFIIEDNTEESR